jgi:very-short-patch-repair endonuclease
MRPQDSSVEQRIARIASGAKGVVTRRELIAVGVTRAQIKRRLRRGSLIRAYEGVYRVGHRAPSVEASYMAAVKAAGEGALLSGIAAAYLLELIKGDAPAPEVTTRTYRRIDGVKTRRSPAICHHDATKWRGVPVTTVPRILVDVAGALSFDALARACHVAGIRGTKPEHVDRVLARSPKAKGARTLRAILHGDAPILLSDLEKGFRELLKANGLPLPITNRPAGAHYVDCRWPDHRLTVELDSYTYHNSRHAFEQDHRRERDAYERGDRFRRYTYGDVFERPFTVLRELVPLLTETAAAR